MADDVVALLARFALASGDLDVRELLDAVFLASARADAGDAGAPAWSTGTGGPPSWQERTDTAFTADGTTGADSVPAADAEPESVASVWLEDGCAAHTVPGRRVGMGRAMPLPDALALGRALRPLRQPWPHGVHRQLDVDATVEHYARTGMLVPRLAPAPEPWLEAVVVVDRGTAMAVWDDTVRALASTLRALAAFRDVRVWNLEHPPGSPAVLHDHQGRARPMDPETAHHTQPARRLLLVVSDCAAPAWRHDALWRTVHTWGHTAPVALVNPLPRRLWRRSGLDLPHTIASAPVPAAPGRLLSYGRPRLLRDTQDARPWQALPVLEFDPASIGAWARTLMRTDPSGCDAVLVPATGRPPSRPRRLSPSTGPTTVTGAPTWSGPASGEIVRPGPAPGATRIRTLAEAFTDDLESPAVRLAIAVSPLGSFTLPVLDVLRERLIPDASSADIAEFLTAGLLTVTRAESADPVYHLHPAAADHLTGLLTRDRLWDTHFALSDHLADRIQAPHGIPVVLHDPRAEGTLPTGIRPIAHAAAATARLLGVEPVDAPPDRESRSAVPPAAPDDSARAADLHRTLASLFRALLTRRTEGTPVPTYRPRNLDVDWPPSGGLRHRTVIYVDIAEFGGYDEVTARDMRLRLFGLLESALSSVELSRRDVTFIDRGDGVLMTVSPAVPLHLLIGDWLDQVYRTLRALNRDAVRPLRLRVGMDVGPAHQDGMGGVSGAAVGLAARLAESDAGRRALDEERADLVAVVSEHAMGAVLRTEEPFFDIGNFAAMVLRTKEQETVGYVKVPRLSLLQAFGSAPSADAGQLDQVQASLVEEMVRVLTQPEGGLSTPSGLLAWRSLVEQYMAELPSEPRHFGSWQGVRGVVHACALRAPQGALLALVSATEEYDPNLGSALGPLLDEWRAHLIYAGRNWDALRAALQVPVAGLGEWVAEAAEDRLALPEPCRTPWQAFVHQPFMRSADARGAVGLPPGMILLEHLAHHPRLTAAADDMRAWNSDLADAWGLWDAAEGHEGLRDLRNRLKVERVLADRERVLGGDHPRTVDARHELALAYAVAGRTAEAVGLLERVVADRERLLGTDHGDTMAAHELLSRLQRQA
ncbi:SAV_2336 N-terminal domain-related protein [Streptomyces galbus]|uniref:SAV_2336 N-terminal domain-related protein n=1 Tax=Streptomyces galbus TaxID=33898 RepID=UPI0038020382